MDFMSKIKVIDRIIRSGAAEIASEFLSQDEVAESRNCVCSFIRDGFRPECHHCKYSNQIYVL